jgi:hypothetical protein
MIISELLVIKGMEGWSSNGAFHGGQNQAAAFRDPHGIVKGNGRGGGKVDHLILPESIEIELKIVRCPVVELNGVEMLHVSEGFNVLAVTAAQMDHAGVGIDPKHLLVAGGDELVV